jgi:hypothetical protein
MKTKYVLICALVLVVGLAGFYVMVSKNQTQPKPSDSENTLSPMLDEKVSYECEAGKSAFDVLDEKNEIKYSESSFGKLVTSINGKSQGDGKYWLYSIDEKEATVGANAYICIGKEEIKWELK